MCHVMTSGVSHTQWCERCTPSPGLSCFAQPRFSLWKRATASWGWGNAAMKWTIDWEGWNFLAPDKQVKGQVWCYTLFCESDPKKDHLHLVYIVYCMLREFFIELNIVILQVSPFKKSMSRHLLSYPMKQRPAATNCVKQVCRECARRTVGSYGKRTVWPIISWLAGKSRLFLWVVLYLRAYIRGNNSP